MICVSIREPTVDACLHALKNLTFAEVRIDAMHHAVAEDIRKIFSRPLTLIATFRPEGLAASRGGPPGMNMRKQLLMTAIDAGASYVDIESGSDSSYRSDIIDKARRHNCRVIISFHDFHGTPQARELAGIISGCFNEGADIAKIACTVNSEKDNLRLLNILGGDDFNGRIVVVGMGDKGRITRVAAPLLGSPFTFASLTDEKKTADGQINKDALESILKVLNSEEP